MAKKSGSTSVQSKKTATNGSRSRPASGGAGIEVGQIKANPSAIDQVNRLIKESKADIIDFKFNDLPGQWQHFSIPTKELTSYSDINKSIWVDGIGFDGSSIRGFQKIHESDMILIPDPSTAVVDPVCQIPTLSIICDIYDPLTRKPYSRDPRFIARKAEAYLKGTGIADTVFFGPEAEFFLFNDIRFDQNENSGYYYIDSAEGDWNTGKEEKPNLGYKPRYKEGYLDRKSTRLNSSH